VAKSNHELGSDLELPLFSSLVGSELEKTLDSGSDPTDLEKADISRSDPEAVKKLSIQDLTPLNRHRRTSVVRGERSDGLRHCLVHRDCSVEIRFHIPYP
jgi:hypothetical protein